MTDVLKAEPTRPLSRPKTSSLTILNLFADFGAMLDLLSEAVESRDWLDIFLVAAGIQQLVDDHSSRVMAFARRGASYLESNRIGLLRSFSKSAVSIDWALKRRAIQFPRARQLARQSNLLSAYLHDLAFVVLANSDPQGMEEAVLQDRGRMLGANLSPLSALFSDEMVRLPSCFRSFDQRPADIAALVSKFASQWPLRERPMCVVGVRTSGSYLAPLCAAALAQHGFSDVTTMTVRPAWPIGRREREALVRAVKGGRVLVLDDPPASGRSIERVVSDLDRRMGVPPESVALLLGVLSDSIELGGILQKTTTITLPFGSWDCHRLLTSPNVKETLGRLLGDGSEVLNVEPTRQGSAPTRDHLTNAFNVAIRDCATGVTSSTEIVAEGVGIGYFGRHATAIAMRAPHLFPNVLGFDDGFLYRRALPGDGTLANRLDSPNAAEQVARHVAERKNALRVDSDPSVYLTGRQPAWEVATSIVERSLGPLALALRGPVVAPLVRRILHVSDPSLPDSMTSTAAWFAPANGTVAVKANFAEGPFSHLDLASFDAAFDLAGAAVGADDEAFADDLRRAYANYSAPIDPERWMLLQLVHSWNECRLGRASRGLAARRNARIVHRYFAERFLVELTPTAGGPWCAFDLDGVLETSPLGFPATTAAGALALRALLAHGYRIVLASGRSLCELAERCAIFGFPAAVAEYGSVVYDHLHNVILELVPSDEADQLAVLRKVATDRNDLVVDDDYLRIVRMYRYDSRGRRHGLDAVTAAQLMESCPHPEAIVVVQGEEQTDFVASSVDKGTAISTLFEHLQEAGGEAPSELADPVPLAFAMGDSATDASFLQLAHRSFAPANAHASLRKSGTRIVRRAYQAGAGAAVAAMIGHQPGHCPICRAPRMDDAPSAFIGLLSIQEAGPRGAVRRVLRLVRSSFPKISLR